MHITRFKSLFLATVIAMSGGLVACGNGGSEEVRNLQQQVSEEVDRAEEPSHEDEHEDHGSKKESSATEIPEDAQRFIFELQPNGQPAGGEATYRVDQGDTVAFIVHTQVEGAFHVHGYNRAWAIAPGEETMGLIQADATGRFPLEVHIESENDGVLAGYLEVHP